MTAAKWARLPDSLTDILLQRCWHSSIVPAIARSALRVVLLAVPGSVVRPKIYLVPVANPHFFRVTHTCDGTCCRLYNTLQYIVFVPEGIIRFPGSVLEMQPHVLGVHDSGLRGR